MTPERIAELRFRFNEALECGDSAAAFRLCREMLATIEAQAAEIARLREIVDTAADTKCKDISWRRHHD